MIFEPHPINYTLPINTFIDCNKKQESLQKKIDILEKEEKLIVERQAILKKELYGKFGDSINLEA